MEEILNAVKDGSLGVETALKSLRYHPYEDIGCAKIDNHRELISGTAEVVYATGKKRASVIEIARKIYDTHGCVLVTRADEETYGMLNIGDARYYPDSRIIEAVDKNSPRGKREKVGHVLVVSAGTSDISVAEEAAVTAGFLGSHATTLFDVGVAGLHRLLSKARFIDDARVLVVIAGMEGALPSVIGALTDKPIIAVPTSQGYGTALGGITALFAMLNSCVPGIAVMNIDNGFGAGCLAHKINSIGL